MVGLLIGEREDQPGRVVEDESYGRMLLSGPLESVRFVVVALNGWKVRTGDLDDWGSMDEVVKGTGFSVRRIVGGLWVSRL